MTPKNIIERPDSRTPQSSNHGAVARGLGQTFGILPSMALLTLVVDTMLFGGELGSVGLSLPISCATGGVLGIITFLAQRKWYGDDTEAALIKGLILAFLTAIPTPLPAMLYVPSGIVGLVHNLRRK
jgi:hypothetical protein